MAHRELRDEMEERATANRVRPARIGEAYVPLKSATGRYEVIQKEETFAHE